MSGEKPLSSVDSAYNDLGDKVRSSNYPDFYTSYNIGERKFNTSKGVKNIVDTQSYLASLEQKYEKQHKKHKTKKTKRKYSSSSSSSYESAQDSDSDEDGFRYKKGKNQDDIPSKFTKMSKSRVPTNQNVQMAQSYMVQQPISIPSQLPNQTPIKESYQVQVQQQVYEQHSQSQIYQVFAHQNDSPGQGFHIPQNLSLSKGPSERIVQSPEQSMIKNQQDEPHWQILEQMHQEYSQNQTQNKFFLQQLHQPNPDNSRIIAPQSVSHQKQPSQSQNLSTEKGCFFDLVVKMKDQLPLAHPGKHKLVAQLYAQCQKDGIPESQWQQWIQQQLQ